MSYIHSLAARAREASHAIAALEPERRAGLLRAMAKAVDAGRAQILSANAGDMQRAEAAGTTGAML
ncbi:MAG: gamma-glutamyl-phosphate reductase, partial [Gammaproteobacteria bacterium]|nr:gamma-glutamyl-phosphate reductase [Gammaproteobacteria bacterium]